PWGGGGGVVGSGEGDGGAVEGEGFVDDGGVGPSAAGGEEAVSEVVLSLVGEGVGVEGAAEETETEDVGVGAVAVLAVVEEGDAVAGFGEVGEAVGGPFEACRVPGGVAVGGAADGAVHRL